MTRHRADPPPWPDGVSSTSRRSARRSWLVTLASSLAVTAIAVLGALAMISPMATGTSSGPTGTQRNPTPGSSAPTDAAAGTSAAVGGVDPAPAAAVTSAAWPLPGGSGSGRRVVFDESEQRVWLVNERELVVRSYLVSGSVTDNLDPGTYAVYSRSPWANGVSDSGVMRFFVRFTEGPTGSAIGFHDIPTKNGEPLQTVDQLGSPQSHGCIRQARKDAVALWGFAPVGTAVVVTA